MLKTILTYPFKLIGKALKGGDKAYMTVEKPNEATGKFEKVLYTPYFIEHYQDESHSFRLKVFVTLGRERLPPGYMQTKDSDLIERVTEVYFLNDGIESKTFKAQSISLEQGVDQTFFNSEQNVLPGSQVISPPVIDLDIPFGTGVNFVFKYQVDNKDFELKAMASRFTQEQMNQYING